MADPRFTKGVGSQTADQLKAGLQAAIKEVERRFPGSGIALFVFDFEHHGGQGLGYICNGSREDIQTMLEEWIRKTRARLN